VSSSAQAMQMYSDPLVTESMDEQAWLRNVPKPEPSASLAMRVRVPAPPL
jgi:hypothetical protein